MPDDAAVMDVGAVDTGTEISADQTQQQPDELAGLGDGKIDGRKFTQEYRAWLKSLKDDPVAGKWAKQSYNDHGRIVTLEKEIDPKGLDGVRDTYEYLKSIGGREKVDEIVTRVQEQEALDSAILEGNPEVWKMLPEELAKALPKLGPSFMEHWRATDPQGYAASLQPTFFDSVLKSDLTSTLGEMDRILLDKTLTPEQKLTQIDKSMTKVGDWYQNNKQLAEKSKPSDEENPWKKKWEERETQDKTQAEDHFWKQEVTPPLAQYENEQFKSMYAPYAKRLNLDQRAMDKLQGDFKRELTRLGSADEEYMKGMTTFRGAKNRNAVQIQTFAKNGIQKHAKEAFETALNDRYGFYLKTNQPGKQQAKGVPPITGKDGKTVTPVVVSQKPNPKDVDWNAWKRLDSKSKYTGVYPLRNGQIVHVRHA
jgi:hypothetical protein